MPSTRKTKVSPAATPITPVNPPQGSDYGNLALRFIMLRKLISFLNTLEKQTTTLPSANIPFIKSQPNPFSAVWSLFAEPPTKTYAHHATPTHTLHSALRSAFPSLITVLANGTSLHNSTLSNISNLADQLEALVNTQLTTLLQQQHPDSTSSFLLAALQPTTPTFTSLRQPERSRLEHLLSTNRIATLHKVHPYITSPALSSLLMNASATRHVHLSQVSLSDLGLSFLPNDFYLGNKVISSSSNTARKHHNTDSNIHLGPILSTAATRAIRRIPWSFNALLLPKIAATLQSTIASPLLTAFNAANDAALSDLKNTPSNPQTTLTDLLTLLGRVFNYTPTPSSSPETFNITVESFSYTLQSHPKPTDSVIEGIATFHVPLTTAQHDNLNPHIETYLAQLPTNAPFAPFFSHVATATVLALTIQLRAHYSTLDSLPNIGHWQSTALQILHTLQSMHEQQENKRKQKAAQQQAADTLRQLKSLDPAVLRELKTLIADN